MRAMILAAGLGTRLRPLTFVRPKALVPLMGASILDFWMQRLYREGFQAAVVNAFHHADQIVEAIAGRHWPIPVDVRVEPVLLDTGGGVRNALDLLGSEPFAVINGDILCDAPLAELYHRHIHSGAPASLLLHDFPEFNNVAVSPEGAILAFGKEAIRLAREDSRLRLLAFTGIHFMSPAIVAGLPPGLPESVLTPYRCLIREGCFPRALFHPGMIWREMGAVDSYRRLGIELSRMAEGRFAPIRSGLALCVHPRAWVAPDVRMEGCVTIGAGCRVLGGSLLSDTILWDGVRVGAGSRLRRCIVTDDMEVQGDYEDELLYVERRPRFHDS